MCIRDRIDIYVNGAPSQVSTDEKSGSFVLKAGQLSDAGDLLTVEVGIKAKGQLEGDEALELKLSNEPKFKPTETSSATAKIANFDDCGIDGLVQEVRAVGACIDDGNANKALFAYEVRLSGSYNQDQTYYYEFEGNKNLDCLLYTSPSPRDRTRSRMPSSA